MPTRDTAPPRGDKADASAPESPGARQWNEPGSILTPEKPLDSGKIQLTEMGSGDEIPPSPVLKRNVADAELDRSLMGLDLLAEQTKAEAVLRASGAPPSSAPAAQASEWLWYGAALFILGGSIVAYLWM